MYPTALPARALIPRSAPVVNQLTMWQIAVRAAVWLYARIHNSMIQLLSPASVLLELSCRIVSVLAVRWVTASHAILEGVLSVIRGTMLIKEAVWGVVKTAMNALLGPAASPVTTGTYWRMGIARRVPANQGRLRLVVPHLLSVQLAARPAVTIRVLSTVIRRRAGMRLIRQVRYWSAMMIARPAWRLTISTVPSAMDRVHCSRGNVLAARILMHCSALWICSILLFA